MARSQLTPLKAEYIGADQLPLFVFRLQLCGGPYIPISRFTGRGIHINFTLNKTPSNTPSIEIRAA